MIIATALGVGLTVLLGTALMTLVFISNRAATTTGRGQDSRGE